MKIESLKPIIKRVIGKQYRPVLTKVLSNGVNLSFTNLETYIVLKNVKYPAGLLDVDGLGLTNSICGMDVADYPVFPEVKTKNKITVSIKNLELLLESASKDETRIYLNCVAWIDTDLVSIDGHILTLIENQTRNKNNQTLMPRLSIKELINMAKKFKLNEVTIIADDQFFKVDNENFILMGRLIARDYAKYKSIIPVKTNYTMYITNMIKFKTIKDILNRSNGIKLETTEIGETKLIVQGTDFSTVVGTSDYDSIIGFNLKYLTFLTDLDTTLKFNNSLSPVVVTKNGILRIAMPLKV